MADRMPKNFINFFDIAKLENINLSYAKSRIGESGLEGIKEIPALRPIAHLFREFEKGLRKQYGIRKSFYDRWKQTGEVPKVSSGRPSKWTGEEKNINIPAPPFYERFKAGIKKANSSATQQVTIRQIIYIAIEEYMARRPTLFGVDSDEKDNIQPSPGNKR